MDRPWASVILPTIGRGTLARTLQSIRRQVASEAVEILVVGDTWRDDFAAPLAGVPALCAQYAARYVPYAGTGHYWGHEQRQYGATQARGAWLLYSQDDNVYCPGAFAAIAAACAEPSGPRLFQVATAAAGIVWRVPALRVGNIDADCICTPNAPARLGQWALRYTGDFTFIAETCAAWDAAPRWEPTVIAQTPRGAGA